MYRYCSLLFALTLLVTCFAQSVEPLPIGFTVIRQDQGHRSAVDNWIGIVRPGSKPFVVERVKFNQPFMKKGTQFMGWLRDQKHAIVLGVEDKTHIDAYIVDRSGVVTVRLTEAMHNYAEPSVYHDGVFPIYCGNASACPVLAFLDRHGCGG